LGDDVGTIILLVLMVLILYIAMKYLRGPKNENTSADRFIPEPFTTSGEKDEGSASNEHGDANELQNTSPMAADGNATAASDSDNTVNRKDDYSRDGD